MNILVMLNDIKANKKLPLEQEKSQMQKLLEKDIIKVAVYKNTAYWVLNNVIYRAQVDRDGNILHDRAEEIDVFKLSEKEVENLLTIIDSINI